MSKRLAMLGFIGGVVLAGMAILPYPSAEGAVLAQRKGPSSAQQDRAFLDDADPWRSVECFAPPCPRVGYGVQLYAPERSDGWLHVRDEDAFLLYYHWAYRMTSWNGYEGINAYALYAPGNQLDHDGRYQILVLIPAVEPAMSLTERATYHVHTGSTTFQVTVNQSAGRGHWVSLGQFDLHNATAMGGPDGAGPWVELRDHTGELDGRAVVVDAMDWREVLTVAPTLTPQPTATRTRTPQPTPTPSRTHTPPPAPTATTVRPSPTTVPSLAVWISAGCGHAYAIGSDIEVLVEADRAGIAHLRWEPRGEEFAVRSLRADEPIMVSSRVAGPAGAQEIVAELEIRGTVVATATCRLQAVVDALPTATPTKATRRKVLLPMLFRDAVLQPMATGTSAPRTPTGRASSTPRRSATPTRTPVPPSPVPPLEQSLVVVDGAISGWQDVRVAYGGRHQLDFRVVAGKWTHWKGRATPNPGIGEAASCDTCPLPQARKGSLIGRIGAGALELGAGRFIEPRSSGAISLAMNDDPAGFGDNEGKLSVLISELDTAPSALARVIAQRVFWQPTSVVYEAGDTVRIDVVDGTWTHWDGTVAPNPGVGEGACGSSCLMPEATKGALIARIGDQMVAIGRGSTIRTGTGGRIDLSINDDPAGGSDNRGELTVRLEHR